MVDVKEACKNIQGIRNDKQVWVELFPKYLLQPTMDVSLFFRKKKMYKSCLILSKYDLKGNFLNTSGWDSAELHNKQPATQALRGRASISITSAVRWTLSQPAQLTWLSLHVPGVCSELGRSAFSFSAPDLWNEIKHTLELSTLLALNVPVAIGLHKFILNLRCLGSYVCIYSCILRL